ncbi:hypothetical protein SAMN05421748_101141 [Paractinoplanes atraurantiacus]|uniref:Uncharacterized protein n=1 Tax=Paractinoplanes atraurantiacus TaxID=1036182 RepID=A0A285EYJ3_9ACTN|nr:hypothetical protein SAMN05421748_101141 [Actinoplanes atraurantiacus]
MGTGVLAETDAHPPGAAFTNPSNYPLLLGWSNVTYLPSLVPRAWKSSMPKAS